MFGNKPDLCKKSQNKYQMKYNYFLILCFCMLACVSRAADPFPANINLDAALNQATDVSAEKPTDGQDNQASFTTDTQIRILSLFEPATNNQLTATSEEKPASDTYFAVDGVPLKSLLHLLARRSGLNYLEPSDELPEMDEEVTLEMKEPKPRDLLDTLLKHRNLELYDAGTGLWTIRAYTNQLSFFKFKIKDNFMDKFKGSAQSSGGGGGGGGNMGGGGGSGNAVSASQTFTVENGGKYGDIEGILQKVADTEGGKNTKIWYFDEKQTVLMYGTKTGAERISRYLEIANQKNPNIRIDVRVYTTGNNPQSRFGVDWSQTLNPGFTFGIQPPGTSSSSGSSGSSGTNGSSSSFPGYNSLKSIGSAFGNPLSNIILQNNLQATVNFFVTDSKAESVTEPSAITANDREVAFAATEQIPYISGSASTGSSSYGNTGNSYNNTAFISVGANINILPRIEDGLRMKLGIAISLSQLDQMVTVSAGTGGSAPQQVPQTSGRAYNGELTLNSGDTVVIAGLKTHSLSKTLNKVPYLGDIPGLGKLFRNDDSQKQNSYLTIFITATILDSEGNPGIPEGHIAPRDNYPDNDSTMSADANYNSITHSDILTDKALINSRREALQIRTEQANKIIATRMDAEAKVEKLNDAYKEKDDEITEIKNDGKLEIKAAKNSEIESVRKEVQIRLGKATKEKELIFSQMQAAQQNLAQLSQQESAANQAVEKADTAYTKSLSQINTGSGLKETTAKQPVIAPVQTGEPLDENAELLKTLQ